MPPRTRRTTLKDVAAATGLSVATVSYALRGLQVPEETQQRVREAAQELGYEANPVARALAGGRTGAVGVLCGSLEDLWQQRLAVALSRALLERDLYAIITDAAGSPGRELQLVRELRDRRVDAVVAVPLDPAGDHWVDLARTTPLVTVGDAVLPEADAGAVLFDNAAGIRMALEHLAALGHRDVVVLTPSLPSTPGRPADALAVAAAGDLGLRLTLAASPASVAGAAAVVGELLDRAARPTAVFGLSDSMAFGVYLAAQRRGLAVPGDVSVLGYDDHQLGVLVDPPLDSFGWDEDGIVAAAVGQLVESMADPDGIDPGGRPNAVRVFAPRLLARGSTGPCPRTDASARDIPVS